MSLTIDLPAVSGESPPAFPAGFFDAPPRRPASPPAWVLELAPRNPATDGTNAMHRAFGQWPGDETDHDLLALERHLDDEDTSRV